MNERFSDVLKEYMGDRTPGELAKIADVPKSTIVSWLETVERPRSWPNIVKVAVALELTKGRVNRLLEAAGQSLIDSLCEQARDSENIEKRDAISHWEKHWRSMQQRAEADATSKSWPPFQVPAQTEHFIGRQQHIAEIEQIVFADHQTCVIHGMAGVGKTSLALEAAYRLRDKFPDGILWANLAQAVNLEKAIEGERLNEDVLKSILSSFTEAYGSNIRDENDLGARSQIFRNVMANREALIVLDNAHGAADVAPLLPPIGKCAVLITTRNQGLLRDSHASRIALAPFVEEESIDLLKIIVGKKRIDDEPVIAQTIINRLGGLPLALKVVASTLVDAQTMTLAEYDQFLENELERLKYLDDWKDASKSVRASFELSFKRLLEDEQQLFTFLSLFDGPDISIEAIAAVANLTLAKTKLVLGKLSTLSLINDDPQAGRFKLHPLLRTFTREKRLRLTSRQLDFVPEQRAAAYFAQLAETHQNPQKQAYDVLERDWQNLVSAMRWAYEHKDWTNLIKGVQALTHINLGSVGFLDTRGYWSIALELLELLEAVLNSPVVADDPEL